MSTSIMEQLRAAVDAGGGQTAVANAIRAAGGKTTQSLLSRLCGGDRASVPTLVEVAKAVPGWVFTIDGETDIGASRLPNPSELKKKKKRRRRQSVIA
jgi:hypothetical protein